jgi:hypothetical protein
MCQFKSAIVLKSKIHCPLNTDSHEDMIRELGLRDDSPFPNFVRIEHIPKDGDPFNHDPANWILNVDQDKLPDWFDDKKTEAEMQEIIKDVFAKCFVIDDDSWKEYKDTKLFVRNAKVKTVKCSVVARGNSSVVARGNSSVEAWGNSSVEAWGNSSVEARGNSSVEAWENSSVVARENSSVEAWGNSSVEARGNSSVEAWENSSVEAWGNSSVEAWENSSVVARENSSVEAWGNSSVEAWGNSQILLPKTWYRNNVKIKNINDLATVKDLREDKPKIIIASDFEIIKFAAEAIKNEEVNQ